MFKQIIVDKLLLDEIEMIIVLLAAYEMIGLIRMLKSNKFIADQINLRKRNERLQRFYEAT